MNKCNGKNWRLKDDAAFAKRRRKCEIGVARLKILSNRDRIRCGEKLLREFIVCRY